MSEKNLERVETEIAVDDSELNSSFEETKATAIALKVPFSKKRELFFSKEAAPKVPKRPFFLWNPPGRSAREKKLVFKIDCIILTYTCLSFFVKYLDLSNVSNAYLSGMKEDYNMHGTQFNWLKSTFSLVYAIFGLPGTVLMTKIKPHILLPSCELIWGLLTLMVIATTNYNGIITVRAFQGAVEGMSYPSINYILGSWYTKEELTKRTAVFCISGTLGTMFGGYIQSGIYDSLHGKGSLPPWKWAFVIDFLITLPVALLGFFILPDNPSDMKPNFLFTEEDIELSRQRVALKEGNLVESNKFEWAMVKRALTSWQWFIFPLAYSLDQVGEYVSEYWGVALKAEGYSVYQSNNYPTIASAVGILVCLSASVWCDFRQNYWELYTAINLYWIFSFAVIVKYDVGSTFRFFAFATSKMNDSTAAIICSWANDMMRHDRQLRAFVLGSLNIYYAAFYTPISNTVWNTDLAPRYQRAHNLHLGLQCCSTVFCLAILLFDRYQRKYMAYINSMADKGTVEYEEGAVEYENGEMASEKI